MMLHFTCPSCASKLAGIEPAGVATQVVRRTCRHCGERWQLVVTPLTVREDLRMDRATFAFLGRREAHCDAH